MSQGPKQNYDAALANATAFCGLFGGVSKSWTIAGSLRRMCTMVGDVEHVVIPTIMRIEGQAFLGGGGDVEEINGLWQRSEFLLRDKVIEKAIYPDGKNRWGPRYRGMVFHGVRHEIFLGDERNLGAILAIRTGPADFSEHLVTVLKRRGLVQKEGYLRMAPGGVADMEPGGIVDVPTEESFFVKCGVPFIEANKRDQWSRILYG